jgi:hypothetical protein
VAQKNVVIALQASNSRLISERSELEAQVVGLKYLQDTGGFLSALLKSEK